MSGLATLDACLRSAATDLAERPVDVRGLVDATVTAVVPHRDGYRLCFTNGTVIHIERGATFDVAGNPAIEPAPPAPISNPRPLQFSEPGQPAAAPVAVHARGGGAFGDI